MRAFAAQSNLEVWYARLDVEAAMGEIEAEDPKAVKQVRKGVDKARAKDSLRALEKLTEVVDGELRIRSEPPLLVPGRGADDGRARPATSSDFLRRRARVLPRQPARPTASTCSTATASATSPARWSGSAASAPAPGCVLLTGADDGDPLFLQAKEAEASVLEPYAGASRFENHGRRVVEGQRLMQAASDIFLGWCPAVGLDGRAARLLRAPALGLEALGRSRDA